MKQAPKYADRRGAGTRARVLRDAKTRQGRRKILNRQLLFDAGAIWWKAICDSDIELKEHCAVAKKDQLRFYGFRLLEKLCKQIENSELDNCAGMFRCYSFITAMSGHGYAEPWRLHGEEMTAAGSRASARSFCSSARRLYKQNPVAFTLTLGLRLESIASWIETQLSFSHWLVFKHCRAVWRGDDEDQRNRALQAAILATLPQRLLPAKQFRGRRVKGAHLWEGLGIGTNCDSEPFNGRQWSNILEQAARLAEKEQDCSEFDRWLWWCYPVFTRYGWNTREVQEAAGKRGFTEAERMHEQNFRRRLMSMGLRIGGQKHKRSHTAPLAEFVLHVRLPDTDKVRGCVIWY
jgi:hypothetical protein